MNEKSDNIYFHFPIDLLRGVLWADDEVMQKIYDFGVFKFASGLNLDERSVINRLMYSYYNDQIKWQALAHAMGKYNDQIDKYPDYRGFANIDGSFELDEEDFSKVKRILDDDEELKSMAVIHAQFETARLLLKQKGFRPDRTSLWNKYDWFVKYQSELPDKCVWGIVNAVTLYEYRDRTEIELRQLAAYIAIGSITGKAKFRQTNSSMIAARMLGYKSPKHIPDDKFPILTAITIRWRFDRLRSQLEDKWNLRFFSQKGMKGFFVGGAEYLQDMANEYVKRGKAMKANIIKQEKEAALQQARKNLM